MQNFKILMIDDNIDMLIIGKRIFERAGHTFFESRNGNDGFDIALSEFPDIIVLDYMLPDMHGTDFIHTLSSEEKYQAIKNIPIVILTARPNYIKELDECFKKGLKAFLHKPFGHRELVNVVENIILAKKIGPNNNKISSPIESVNTKYNGTSNLNEEWLSDVQSTSDALRGMCSVLKSTEYSNLSEEQLVDLQAIFNSSSRLDKLLKIQSEKVV
jgi:CheY-like chemotaxis protein